MGEEGGLHRPLRGEFQVSDGLYENSLNKTEFSDKPLKTVTMTFFFFFTITKNTWKIPLVKPGKMN